MKSFNEIYQSLYKECNETLEEARKQAKIYKMSMALTVLLIILAMMNIVNQSWIMTVICVCFISAIWGYCFKKMTNINYEKMFKEQVITRFVKEYSEELDFFPASGVPYTVYSEAEFERFDKYYSEDEIKGTISKEHNILMSEVKTMEEVKDQDGNTQYKTIFHGLFAKIDLEKIIYFNLKIRKDAIIEITNSQDKMNMDSTEFEKIFTVYATNKIMAMQILTADVMQMLIDFKNKNHITPEITIKCDKLYIRFNTGSVFEGKVFKKALDFDTLLKYYNIINFTLELTENIIKNIQEIEL